MTSRISWRQVSGAGHSRSGAEVPGHAKMHDQQWLPVLQGMRLRVPQERRRCLREVERQGSLLVGTAILHRQIKPIGIFDRRSGWAQSAQPSDRHRKDSRMKCILIMCLTAALCGPGAVAAEPLPSGNHGYTPNSQDMHYFEKAPPGPVELPHGAIKKIRVQKVTDPRCPDIGDEDFKKVLLKAKELAQKHLALELMFTPVGDMPLQTFMKDEEARLAEYFISAPAMPPPAPPPPHRTRKQPP